MSDEVRDLRTIHLSIPDDATPEDADVFEDALADFVQAPGPRPWDPFMHSHTEACEHSDHCYGPGSKAERAAMAKALREYAADLIAKGNGLAPEDDWGESMEATVQADVLRWVGRGMNIKADEMEATS
jgi:hypothetical protein